MAAGEYVSVSSQSDVEQFDRLREQREQADEPDEERLELAALYRARGLDADLAAQVVDQLMRRNPVGTHLRDELGVTSELAARPIQAALASAATLCAGAIIPVVMVGFVPRDILVVSVTIATLFLLVILGAVGARAGGASMVRGALRVTFWEPSLWERPPASAHCSAQEHSFAKCGVPRDEG